MSRTAKFGVNCLRRLAFALSLLAVWPGPVPCWHCHSEVADRALAWHAQIHHPAEAPRTSAWHFHFLLPWELNELQEGNEPDSPLNPTPDFSSGLLVIAPPPVATQFSCTDACQPVWLAPGADIGICLAVSRRAEHAGTGQPASAAGLVQQFLCGIALC